MSEIQGFVFASFCSIGPEFYFILFRYPTLKKHAFVLPSETPTFLCVATCVRETQRNQPHHQPTLTFSPAVNKHSAFGLRRTSEEAKEEVAEAVAINK